MKSFIMCLLLCCSSLLMARTPSTVIQKSSALAQTLRSQGHLMSQFELSKASRLLDNLLDLVGGSVIMSPGSIGSREVDTIPLLIAIEGTSGFSSNIVNAIIAAINVINSFQLDNLKFICDGQFSSHSQKQCLLNGLKAAPIQVKVSKRVAAQATIKACQKMTSSSSELGCLVQMIEASNTIQGDRILDQCVGISGFSSAQATCIKNSLQTIF